jgi:Na+/H+-dicarboxylate symporter
MSISSARRTSLPARILIGLALGIGWAVRSSFPGWSRFTMDRVAPFGDIFINLLKLIASPLALFSIISGVARLSDLSRPGSGLGGDHPACGPHSGYVPYRGQCYG